MARALAVTFGLVLLLSVVAGVAYQVGVSTAATVTGTAGATAVAAYPYWHPFAFGFFPFFGLLFPIFFLFLIFGLFRAAFGGGHRMGYGGGPRMFDEWHRQAHERGTSGKADS